MAILPINSIFKLAVNETKLYENLSCSPHAATAIALNYSVENIQNDICQKITEKSQFDSLVWGSLMLAPITDYQSQIPYSRKLLRGF